MRVRDCEHWDLGTAGEAILVRHRPQADDDDDVLPVFVDPGTYAELVDQDATITVRHRNSLPYLFLRFPGQGYVPLHRWLLRNEDITGYVVHHRIQDGTALNYINVKESLEVLTRSQHSALHDCRNNRRRPRQKETTP